MEKGDNKSDQQLTSWVLMQPIADQYFPGNAIQLNVTSHLLLHNFPELSAQSSREDLRVRQESS